MALYTNVVGGFPDYGLEKGDRLKITSGDGCVWRHPDWIEVVAEYPTYILCEYWYRHWTGRRDMYRHCLNKALIEQGDIVFERKDDWR